MKFWQKFRFYGGASLLSMLLVFCCTSIVSAKSTIPDQFTDFYAQNNILFYDPCGGGGSGGGSGVPSSEVEWDNGWISNNMPGYVREEGDAVRLGFDKYTINGGKPNKIVLHYTEGTTGGLAAYDRSQKEEAAHFTIDLKTQEVHQHFSVDRPSGAMIDTDDVRGAIQIEIVGYGLGNSGDCNINGQDYNGSDYCFTKFTEKEWNYLATLLAAINKWGNENNTTIPLSTSVNWDGDVNSHHMDATAFDNTTGIVGHMHAPDPQNHSDPGNIWSQVQEAINRISCTGGGNGDKSSISGANNADKQSSEVGLMTFNNNDTETMKTLLENYGDVAYRAGQVYDFGDMWYVILVHGRFESPDGPGNNYWGIGPGINYANIGEGFDTYAALISGGDFGYKEALEAAKSSNNPAVYFQELQKTPYCEGTCWQGVEDAAIALQAYINSPEGQQVIAQFGAVNCGGVCNTSGASIGGQNVVQAVKDIIELANQNGSEYTWGGGHSGNESDFQAMLSGAPINVDCTGFASLSIYKAFGTMTSFTSQSIFNNDQYEEIDRSNVQPGDVFAYNSPEGHGGIVIEVDNGTVTKIAETGGWEGRSGRNNNIGYSGSNSWSVTNMNGPNGHFFRWKGAN